MAINSSLDPCNLIAFSILCQGYLAAHGGDGLGDAWLRIPANLKKTCQDKKDITEDPSWWALINNDLLIEEIDDLLDEDNTNKLKNKLLVIESGTKKKIEVKDVKGAYEIIKVALSR